jgi:hypothetical protein
MASLLSNILKLLIYIFLNGEYDSGIKFTICDVGVTSYDKYYICLSQHVYWSNFLLIYQPYYGRYIMVHMAFVICYIYLLS